MKNSTKKETKFSKKQQKATKNCLPLESARSSNTKFDQRVIIQGLLSPTTKKLMHGFSPSQKRIITDQFSKMIKKLKVKLASPQKLDNNCKSRFETKTQRFQFADPNNCSKQTIKNFVVTDRKVIKTKSPKAKNKLQVKNSKILSPKKSTRNNSSQEQRFEYEYRNSELKSPNKLKKNQELNKKTVKDPRIKSKRTKNQKKPLHNYYLCGDNFIQINDLQAREMESEVILQNSRFEKDSQLEEMWSQFINQKKKITKNRVKSGETQKGYHKEIQSKVNRLEEQLDLDSPLALDINKQEEELEQYGCNENSPQFKQQAKLLNNRNSEGDEKNELPEVILPPVKVQPKNKNQVTNPFVNEQQDESYSYDVLQNFSPSNIRTSHDNHEQQVIKTRTSATNLQLNANKQILNKLFDAKKITKNQFQQYMDLAISIYDKEMTQIENLKSLIQANQQKIDKTIKVTNQSLRMSQKLSQVQAENLLQIAFGQYRQQSPTHQKQHTPPTSTPQPQCQQSQKQTQQWDINFSQKLLQPIQNPQPNLQLKQLIQTRIGCQLGLLRYDKQKQKQKQKQGEGISTSVLSVYQFIKNFFHFVQNYHLQEFLTYVNMPYGYSVTQRLSFMQGYDTDQQHDSPVIYGLQQVFRPILLQQFHASIFSKSPSSPSTQTIKKEQKIHNRAIFDAINESLNVYRPYYHINGCPYPWSTTQRALTYYFIRQDCYEQLLDKVQMQVLKWSSSLCGLLIPEAIQTSPNPSIDIDIACNQQVQIQQIFQKYTMQTDCQLLQQRQQKIIKEQKIQIQQNYFQWLFHDEFKTALLYELSSCLLEDLADQVGIWMSFRGAC